MYIYTYVRVYVCMYVCILCTCICSYICMHIRIHFLHIHVDTYICIYSDFLTLTPLHPHPPYYTFTFSQHPYLHPLLFPSTQVYQPEHGSRKRRWCSTRKPERHAHEGRANSHTRVGKSHIHHALSCHVSSIKETFTKRAPFEIDLKFAYGLTLPSRKEMGGRGVQDFFGVEPILQGACTQNCKMAEAGLQIVCASQI